MLTKSSQALHNGDNADREAPVDAEVEQEDEEDDDDHVVITTERPEHETQELQQYAADESYAQNNGQQETEQDYSNGIGNGNGNFGYGQNQQGFGSMGFNNMNNFNPMMMQNGMGMPNFTMGMQNMMGEYLRRYNTFPRNRLSRWQGMPGMNMDPSMMFNGGFGGMGGMNDMSMMNMGMGVGNMGGFGGMPGMGMAGGPGFFPGNGGYNQPTFGNNMQQPFHHHRGYGGRPYGRGFRGRGWGGYNRGRGNWQNQSHFQGPNPNYMHQQYQQQPRNFQGDDENAIMDQQQSVRRASPSYEPMDGAEPAVDDNKQDPLQDKAEDGGDTNQADIDITDQTGDAASEVRMQDLEGNESTQPLDEEGIEGKHDFFERSPAQASAEPQPELEASAEASVQDAVNDVVIDGMDNGSGAAGLNVEGGAEIGSMVEGGEEANGAMQGAAQDQFYDQQHPQGYGYGGRGRGGFRGGRGGFRGRGGAYGHVAYPGEPEQAVAPPINAPTGPKALREGKPNHGRYSYSRPAPPVPPAVSSVIEVTREPTPTRDDRGRSRSRSRSVSDRGNMKERDGSRDEYYESDKARHEKRMRRDEDYDYDASRNADANADKLGGKGRSRSETPDEQQSRRRHRDYDEERHYSRSHRDRSRDKHRRRHRSRSPERDSSDKEGDVDGSRRTSKNDRRRDGGYDESKYSRDKEKSRKSSRRDDDYERDYKDRSNNSSKHARSGRDERDRDRDRGKPRPVLEEPQDEIGFKIKGSKSASMQAGANTTMKPPTTFARDRDSRRQSTQDSATGTPNTPAGDPYAEERERRQRERLDRENTLRRQSTQSLGKRTSRDEDEFDVPMGPKSDTGRNVKKPRRKVSYKYEDEVADGYEERDRRWR